MDCRRRWAVDDDRSRRNCAVDEDRRQIRWAIDEDRCRSRWTDEDDQRRGRWAVDDRCRRRREIDDYPPLKLPLRWRNPPPEYPPLELPLKWRNPLPDHLVRNQPAALFRDSPLLRPHSVAHDPASASSSDHTRDSDPLLQDFAIATPPLQLAPHPVIPTTLLPSSNVPTPSLPSSACIPLPCPQPPGSLQPIQPPDSAPSTRSRLQIATKSVHETSSAHNTVDPGSFPLGSCDPIPLLRTPPEPIGQLPSPTQAPLPPKKTTPKSSPTIHALQGDFSLDAALLLLPLCCSDSTPDLALHSTFFEEEAKEVEDDVDKLERAVAHLSDSAPTTKGSEQAENDGNTITNFGDSEISTTLPDNNLMHEKNSSKSVMMISDVSESSNLQPVVSEANTRIILSTSVAEASELLIKRETVVCGEEQFAEPRPPPSRTNSDSAKVFQSNFELKKTYMMFGVITGAEENYSNDGYFCGISRSRLFAKEYSDIAKFNFQFVYEDVQKLSSEMINCQSDEIILGDESKNIEKELEEVSKVSEKYEIPKGFEECGKSNRIVLPKYEIPKCTSDVCMNVHLATDAKIQQTVNHLVTVPASLVAYIEDTKERARDDTLCYITLDEVLHADKEWLHKLLSEIILYENKSCCNGIFRRNGSLPSLHGNKFSSAKGFLVDESPILPLKLSVWRKNGDFTNQRSGMCEDEVDDLFADLVANNGKLRRQYEAIEVSRKEMVEGDLVTLNLLIFGHVQTNQLNRSQKLLYVMRNDGFEPIILTWNGLIAGCMENGLNEFVLEMLLDLQSAGLKPNTYTIGMIIPVCSSLASFEQGKQAHSYAICCGIYADVHIGSTLIESTLFARYANSQRCKIFDPGGLFIFSTPTSLPMTSLDGVEFF